MAKEKPGIPKGTRDFPPEVMKKRNYILNTISAVFRKYGFSQIETPSIENLSVLTGKYGDEGDQLLFKVLNSGDYLQGISAEDFELGYKHLLPKISNKGLRYDLTVPLARFVVMNRNDISFPFKRYQIQPVWRADKPQRGRYREFLQCDADIVGTSSLLCEVEMVGMMSEVMNNLGVDDYRIRVNHRQILFSLSQLYGPNDKEDAFAVIIDKLDKIGWEKVSKDLEKAGFAKEGIKNLEDLFADGLSFNDLETRLSALLDKNGLEAISEVSKVFSMLENSNSKYDSTKIQFDPSLARGLSYYTGMIFEVEIKNAKVGSVCGGGRYDNLTGIFGLPDVPATGFSFGIDRLYDALDELNKFPSSVTQGVKVLIVHFDQNAFDYGMEVLGNLRNSDTLNQNEVIAEMYPDPAKMNKQLNYANKNSFSHVIIVGDTEIQSRKVTLKDMRSGEQELLDLEQVINNLIKE